MAALFLYYIMLKHCLNRKCTFHNAPIKYPKVSVTIASVDSNVVPDLHDHMFVVLFFNIALKISFAVSIIGMTFT